MNPSPPPYYTPAPHLINGSFLTSPELVNLFQDFYASIERIWGAPELVFERVVANLNTVVRTYIEEERSRMASVSGTRDNERNNRLQSELAQLRSAVSKTQLERNEYNNRKKENIALQSSNDRLKAEVAELKSILSRTRLEHNQNIIALASCSHEKSTLQPSDDQHKKDLVLERPTPLTHRSITACEQREKIEPRSSNSKLNKELAPVKPETLAPRTNDLAIRISEANKVKLWDVLLDYPLSDPVSFARPYVVPPKVPLGLTSVHAEFKQALHILFDICDIVEDHFYLYTQTFGGLIRTIGFTGLEIELHDPDFQTGYFNVRKVGGKSLINFPHPYSKPPHVVVWLKGFGFDFGGHQCLSAYATDITTTGFTLKTETWNDSEPYGISISWIAYTADKPNVFSGSFSTPDFHSDDISSYSLSEFSERGYVDFGDLFDAPPRVVVAINKFGMLSEGEAEFGVKAADITSTGMTWQIDGESVYTAGASFIALG